MKLRGPNNTLFSILWSTPTRELTTRAQDKPPKRARTSSSQRKISGDIDEDKNLDDTRILYAIVEESDLGLGHSR